MGRKFGVRWKYATAEEALAAKRAQEKAYNERQKAIRAAERERRLDPASPTALQERNAALSEPRTLTAAIFGDPAPSRSALARRMQA